MYIDNQASRFNIPYLKEQRTSEIKMKICNGGEFLLLSPEHN